MRRWPCGFYSSGIMTFLAWKVAKPLERDLQQDFSKISRQGSQVRSRALGPKSTFLFGPARLHRYAELHISPARYMLSLIYDKERPSVEDNDLCIASFFQGFLGPRNRNLCGDDVQFRAIHESGDCEHQGTRPCGSPPSLPRYVVINSSMGYMDRSQGVFTIHVSIIRNKAVSGDEFRGQTMANRWVVSP